GDLIGTHGKARRSQAGRLRAEYRLDAFVESAVSTGDEHGGIELQPIVAVPAEPGEQAFLASAGTLALHEAGRVAYLHPYLELCGAVERWAGELAVQPFQGFGVSPFDHRGDVLRAEPERGGFVHLDVLRGFFAGSS